MRTIEILQPKKLVFGRGCLADCAAHIARSSFRQALIVTATPTLRFAEQLKQDLSGHGVRGVIAGTIDQEPDIAAFEEALRGAREMRPDVVIGLGGGSPLDTAKLIAAFIENAQTIRDVFGIGLLGGRKTHLICIPTTSGTGSEVSPNAILLDENERLKKGVVSPYLMPDATYVDPLLTVTMPPAVTAGTGLDALAHCIEAYTNKFAHPYVDTLALQGIRLAGASLARAVADGTDLEAREAMSLASVYGGVCLGPVNTAGVHALAYPLGGEFHVPHGLSNAVLLPHVMLFNAMASPSRHADVAVALGAEPAGDPLETARRGVEKLRTLMRQCGVPMTLAQMGVPETAIPNMVISAMKVTRLLKNNPRDLTADDAEQLYRQAYA
jgi:alcohol dehydrogenase class IV